MKDLIDELTEDFTDGEFAHAYMESHRASRIAAQIYALRKDRGWSQSELAQRAGIAQERVSKIESADFDSLTLKTLYKFAKAFDIDMKISFESFSNGIMDVARLNPKSLVVPNRVRDLDQFRNHCSAGKTLVRSLTEALPQVVTAAPVSFVNPLSKWTSLEAE